MKNRSRLPPREKIVEISTSHLCALSIQNFNLFFFFFRKFGLLICHRGGQFVFWDWKVGRILRFEKFLEVAIFQINTVPCEGWGWWDKSWREVKIK